MKQDRGYEYEISKQGVITALRVHRNLVIDNALVVDIVRTLENGDNYPIAIWLLIPQDDVFIVLKPKSLKEKIKAALVKAGVLWTIEGEVERIAHNFRLGICKEVYEGGYGERAIVLLIIEETDTGTKKSVVAAKVDKPLIHDKTLDITRDSYPRIRRRIDSEKQAQKELEALQKANWGKRIRLPRGLQKQKKVGNHMLMSPEEYDNVHGS